MTLFILFLASAKTAQVTCRFQSSEALASAAEVWVAESSLASRAGH